MQLSVLTVAFAIMAGFQTYLLIGDRLALLNARAAQEPTMQQSLKLRHQIDAIATGLAELAASGDTSAQAIIADIRRQGVTVRNPVADAKK
jgi:hypothetical protein